MWFVKLKTPKNKYSKIILKKFTTSAKLSQENQLIEDSVKAYFKVVNAILASQGRHKTYVIK